MTLKERFNAKSTKIGKVFHTWVAGFLLLCTAIGTANEYIALLPANAEYIPTWVKTSIVIAGLVSYIAGKLTVSKESTNGQQ